ncbi:MAG: hypothetical protein ACRDTT_07405 [Pseudonocardiaceae bacterium]
MDARDERGADRPGTAGDGIPYTLHSEGPQRCPVVWDDDRELPVVGGDRRRLTLFNRAQMIQWCGGRAPDHLDSNVMLMGPAEPGAGVVMVGDIVERAGPGAFRIIRAPRSDRGGSGHEQADQGA